jgi:ABC-2 type transport system permease protein
MSTQDGATYYDSNSANQGVFQFIRSLYTQRELLRVLISADLRSRYRRSFIGLLWTLLNPILSSLVMWLVFVSFFRSTLANGTQYAPYLLCGVLAITFFSQGLLHSAESIASGSKIFLKIRVDPKIFCASNVISNAVNFNLGLFALVLVSLLSGATLSRLFPLVFFVVISLTMLTIGLGLICAILFIRFDDFKYIVTVLLQLLTYVTPVFYPKDVLGSHARFLISLNPLTSFLDVFRHVINGTEVATALDWIYMLTFSTLMFIFGIFFFRKFWAKTVVML